MSDTEGFRRVLHEWARRQLEEKSPHAGPFEILEVRLDHKDRVDWSEITFEDALTDVRIKFRHDGSDCPDIYKRLYTGFGVEMRECCEDTVWSPMESNNTVDMINELLAI